MIRSSVGRILRGRYSSARIVAVVRRHGQRQQDKAAASGTAIARTFWSTSNDEKPKVPASTSSSSSEVAPVSEDNLPAQLIDFQAQSKIEGEESHIATIHLKPGDVLRSEAGAMLYMTQGVTMDANLSGASSAFSRMMTGQNMFLTDFKYEGEEGSSGTVALGTDFPSKIMKFSLQDFDGASLICQRGAFLASNPTVNIEMEFTKSLSAGFFGGQGFILQRLTGQGDVLIKGGGTIVCKELNEGESLRVTSGSIVAFEPSVQYDVQMMPGVKNVMFGGEGLFVTNLTGPGRVWLQGMPADRMIAEIARRVPSGGPGIGIPIGGGGGGGAAGEEAGAASGEDGAEDAVATDVGGGGEEMVAASDAAIEADRQAAVATSGVDADSQSALFGDAVDEKEATTTGETAPSNDGFGGDDASWASTSESETTFSDSNEDIFGDEQQQQDESSSSTFGGGDEGGLFEDSTTTVEGLDEAAGEAASEAGGGILQTLWDMFSDS